MKMANSERRPTQVDLCERRGCCCDAPNTTGCSRAAGGERWNNNNNRGSCVCGVQWASDRPMRGPSPEN